jgi:flotillin
MAEGERQRRVLEALGQAEAARAQGQAEAEVIRLQGQAEAEVIKAKGEAEAAALSTRADAYQGYNEAAVLDKMLTEMPQIARAFAEPLGKVDKITIVSTGGSGSGIGASQMVEDLTKMMAQAPALFEALTGQKVSDLMNRLPALSDGKTTNGAAANGRASKSAVMRDAEAVVRDADV